MKKILFAVLLALLAAAAWWWRERSARDAAPRWRETTVERGAIRETVLSTGVLEPQIRLELASPVAGRVEQVLVNEGDAVARGQIVAWVSSNERATLLDAARARGTGELARWEQLYKPTPVIAPLDGTVIARSLEPGQAVSADKPLLVLSDRLIVRAQVDETDMARIAAGQRAEIRLDAYAQQILPARVEHIAYEAKTVNNVTIYNIEVLPEEAPAFIRSGMSAAVTFVLRQTNDVLILPLEAVAGEGATRKVRVPAGRPKDSPESREVQVGWDDGRMVEIRSGIEEGAKVLVEELNLGERSDPKRTPLSPAPGRRRS